MNIDTRALNVVMNGKRRCLNIWVHPLNALSVEPSILQSLGNIASKRSLLNFAFAGKAEKFFSANTKNILSVDLTFKI